MKIKIKDNAAQGPIGTQKSIKLGRGYIHITGPHDTILFGSVMGYTASFGANHDYSHSGYCGTGYNGETQEFDSVCRTVESAEKWVIRQWQNGYIGSMRG